MPVSSHPILSCAQAAAHEEKILCDEPETTWAAIEKAGAAVGKALLKDFNEYAPLEEASQGEGGGPGRRSLNVLTLCGTGHNGADALVATRHVLQSQPQSRALVLLTYGRARLRPLTLRALEELQTQGGDRCEVQEVDAALVKTLARRAPFDLCIEGIVGMQMRPPLRDPAPELLRRVNELPVCVRGAVDLPAGMGDCNCPEGFRADFTYATGIAKSPLFAPQLTRRTGRIRYLDIGFFGPDSPQAPDADKRILLARENLSALRELRPADADKRRFGHLLLIGGSRNMPGAVAMSTLAAARAGAGLLTTLTAQEHAISLAPLVPEAMWRPLPTGRSGSLCPEALSAELDALLPRAGALVLGPGLESDEALRKVLGKIVRECPLALLLDAGALCAETVHALKERPETFPRAVLTPHRGEFDRMLAANGQRMEREEDLEETLLDFARTTRSVTLLKGPLTRISEGEHLYFSPFGGPVLARGGSGDLLSGIIGALLARPGGDPLHCAAQGALWHGLAAESLARTRGQQALRTTELLDHLSPALRRL